MRELFTCYPGKTDTTVSQSLMEALLDWLPDKLHQVTTVNVNDSISTPSAGYRFTTAHSDLTQI